VKDYCETVTTVVDYVVEAPENEDDTIERRNEDIEFNRFDGSGVISPRMAEIWASDLGLDYLPAQFCVRCAFTKGMVTVFDFNEWADDRGAGFHIKDVFGNDVDLRVVDVILTEGQAKLCKSWVNTEDYVQKCHENGIVFGVSLWTPKEDKKHLILNYQFIQTLDMDNDDIEVLCKDTVDYLGGVSVNDINYTRLFLLGEKQTEDSTRAFLKTSDDYWLKTLLIEPNLFNDRYTKQRIRESIIKRIEQAACGKIMVPGNFQVIVPDTVAFMESVYGLPVVGLLQAGEAYSAFWSKNGVERVNTMRSPLTNYSEHYIVNMVDHKEDTFRGSDIRKYFRYAYTGFIINSHDDHTLRWAGSDYDYDIIASTSSPIMIKCVQKGLVPIIGKPLKGKKIQFTDDDRYLANKLTFGSRIGRLTNLASAMCCLRADFAKSSQEYELINSRLKSCCKHQSNQIDKAKAGVEIKDIPKIWTKYNKINQEETDANFARGSQETEPPDTKEEVEKKKLYNRCLVDKHPYFFKYIYQTEKIRFNKYMTAKDKVCKIRFNMSMKDLLSKEIKKQPLTDEQKKFLGIFHAFNGFINSESEMNRLCRHIESIDFEIRKKVSENSEFDYSVFFDYSGFEFNKTVYEQISSVITKYIKSRSTAVTDNYYNFNIEEIKPTTDISTEKMVLKDDLFAVCSNLQFLTNYLIYFFYEDKMSFSKSVFWDVCGKQVYKNVLKTKKSVFIPERDDSGNISFMYKKYTEIEVDLRDAGEDL